MDDVTPTLLREIRDAIVGLRSDTNARFAELHGRVDATNSRLDHLAEGQIRLATEVAGLRGEVGELRGSVHRLEHRFDRFLTTSGGRHRNLEHRVHRLEVHTGLEE
ncbi:MAG: hypothetical protein RIT81_37430 [Deltaproteobacteria bacterium]